MMRSILMIFPLVALSGCLGPTAQTEPAAAAVAAPFTVPMDPGQIRCSALSNQNALAAAVDWTLGQARAGALSGRVAAVPDASALSQTVAAYCAANPNSTVRMAAVNFGLSA